MVGQQLPVCQVGFSMRRKPTAFRNDGLNATQPQNTKAAS